MKVLILTEGGIGRGFGHIARCKALFQALKEKGVAAHLYVFADGSVKSLLASKDVTYVNWLRSPARIEKELNAGDIVCIDSYLAKKDFYSRIAEKCRLLVCLDDNNRISYPNGVVVNGNIYATRMMYPVNKQQTYLCGPEFALVRKEFWRSAKRSSGKTARKILVTYGGSMLHKEMPSVMKMLLEKYPECTLFVTAPKGTALDLVSQEKINKNIKVLHDPAAAVLKKSMFTVDLAISAGGQTLNELARTGVPTIAYAAAKNQLRNVLGWAKRGFIINAGRPGPQLMQRIMSGVALLQDQRLRSRMGKIGGQSVDGKGAQRAVGFILSLYKQRGVDR